MKILITGGAGYIGSVLTKYLMDLKHDVTVVDLDGKALLGLLGEPNLTFIREDITKIEKYSKFLKDVDVVIHLAALVGTICDKEPELAYGLNYVATKELFNECEKYGVKRFIFASTVANYGKTKGGLVKETDPVESTSIYSDTKIKSEKFLLNTKSQTKPTILRFAIAFGLSSRMNWDTTFHNLVKDAVCDKRLVIFGPEYWRTFVHVRDIARAIGVIINTPIEAVGYEIFNVGGNKNNITKGDFGSLILCYLPDTELKIIHTEKDLRDYKVSFNKISKLGFTISTTIEDGIVELKNAILNVIIDPCDDEA